MPTNKLNEFIKRICSIEDKMEMHLAESVHVHTNIAKLQTTTEWIKWIVMGIAGGIGAIVVSLIIFLLKR